jgi:hypothetical protein
MHWQTFYQLHARCHAEEVKALGNLGASLAKLKDGGMRVSGMSVLPVSPKSNCAAVKSQVRPKLPAVPVPSPPEGPGNHDIFGVTERYIPGTVQCRDCANLSVGFRCLAPGSGQVTPSMGEWRQCSKFSRLEIY